MVRCRSPSTFEHIRNQPLKIRTQEAIQWLRENPKETAVCAARLHFIENEKSFDTAWRRARKRDEKHRHAHRKEKKWGGHTKILEDWQNEAVIKYATDQATNGGKGATRQMLFNCIVYLRHGVHKPPPSWRWFQYWLKRTPELHRIKTKPIASQRVDLHKEEDIQHWFETVFRPALKRRDIRDGSRLHNMDEKGARLGCPAGEEVIVPTYIKEMYTGIPENRKSLTIIESVSANGKAIPPVVIVPGWKQMEHWFSAHMTGHELITLSPTGYTNEGICLEWLDHFIKHNNCGPDELWHVLLVDGATCHEAPQFVLKALAHNIEIVKFPSHLTHLLQPLDVGCFRQWKHWQQVAIMNAIRSYEPEYNIRAFFRDLRFIRKNTFKETTIRHAFRDAGMWPVSFKAVQAKINEYGAKKKQRQAKRDENQEEQTNETIFDCELPELLSPSSYAECQAAIRSMQHKVQDLLSSPSRAKYSSTMRATYAYLGRGSLHELEVIQARAAAISHLKNKEHSKKSLCQGKSLTATEALEKLVSKRRQEADDALKKAKRAIQLFENKRKTELKARGIQARKDEKTRKAKLMEIAPQGNNGIIPSPVFFCPIRDPEKQPLPEEIEALTAHPDLDQVLLQAQEQHNIAYSLTLQDLLDFPIDSAILDEERIRLNRPSLMIPVELEEEEEEEESDIESIVDSVASYNSITHNADFVGFN